MDNVDPDLETMFSEAQKQLDRQFKSSTSLREYAKTIIGVSSVIISFFATFKVFDNLDLKANFFPILIFILIAVFYGILMVLAIRASRPYSLHSPINPDLDNYILAYADKDKKEVVMSQINLYLKAIQQNEKIIIEQSNLSNIIGYLLGVMVILIVLETLIIVVS